MRVLAIIVARGGSKRLPRKNLRLLQNRPLIQWTVDFALTCEIFDQIVISTDDAEIMACAVSAGAPHSELRPTELATDTALAADVALYELSRAEAGGGRFDAVALLQPTTPLRRQERWLEAHDLLCKHPDTPGVIGVAKSPASPFHMFTFEDDGHIAPLFPDGLQARSQDLPTSVMVNGSLYLIRSDVLRREKRFFVDGMRAVLCSEPEENIDIDTLEDFTKAEAMLCAGPDLKRGH